MSLQEWASVFQIVGSVGILAAVVVYWCLLRTAVNDLKQRNEESRTVARQNVWHDLFSTFDHINDYINVHQNVVHLPYPEMVSGQQNVVLIFHHMNLILRYWVNQKLLTEDERKGFQRWMDIIFFQWTEKNQDLGRDLKTIIEFEDLFPSAFLTWFKGNDGYKRTLQSISAQ